MEEREHSLIWDCLNTEGLKSVFNLSDVEAIQCDTGGDVFVYFRSGCQFFRLTDLSKEDQLDLIDDFNHFAQLKAFPPMIISGEEAG